MVKCYTLCLDILSYINSYSSNPANYYLLPIPQI